MGFPRGSCFKTLAATMAKRTIATLLTDFGTADPYVAAMKGVILSMCSRARVIDISHEIPPQDVLAGGLVLAEAAPYFPSETLHVVVVDPGVGTDRRIIAGQFGGQIFLFPDNGIITFIAERLPLEAMAVVRNTQYLPPRDPSRTFHGRDIIAPIAGHLLNGLDIAKLGPAPDAYKLLDLPQPTPREDRVVGQVIYVDRFGNLVSNIPEQMVRERYADMGNMRVVCAGRDVGPLQGTYAFVDPGETLALFNSMGYVEVAVNRGRACDLLQAGVGAEVEIRETTD